MRLGLFVCRCALSGVMLSAQAGRGAIDRYVRCGNDGRCVRALAPRTKRRRKRCISCLGKQACAAHPIGSGPDAHVDAVVILLALLAAAQADTLQAGADGQVVRDVVRERGDEPFTFALWH